MKSISENLCSLRKVICSPTNTETIPKPGSSFNLLSSEDSAAVGEKEKQIGEHSTFPKIKEEAWDPELDNLVKHEEADVFRNQVKLEKGESEDEIEDNLLREDMERTCLMPRISECKLQDLEQQAEEKYNDVSHQFSEVLNREGITYLSVVDLLCCINAQGTNILGFVGCMLSVAPIQFFHYKAAIDTCKQLCLCASIKLYLKIQRATLTCEIHLNKYK